MKKELDLDKSTEIVSYAHHAYLNSIANRIKIAILHLNGFLQDNWHIVENDIECVLNKQNNTITFCERKNRLSNKAILERTCKSEDSIVLKLVDISLINAYSYVKVNVEQQDQKNIEKNTLFSYYWNQYDITFGNEKYRHINHFNAYYKVVLAGKNVKVLISADNVSWEKIYEKK